MGLPLVRDKSDFLFHGAPQIWASECSLLAGKCGYSHSHAAGQWCGLKAIPEARPSARAHVCWGCVGAAAAPLLLFLFQVVTKAAEGRALAGQGAGLRLGRSDQQASSPHPPTSSWFPRFTGRWECACRETGLFSCPQARPCLPGITPQASLVAHSQPPITAAWRGAPLAGHLLTGGCCCHE